MMFTASTSEPRRAANWAKPTADTTQNSVANRDHASSSRSSLAHFRRSTTSTTVVEASAFSSLMLEFMAAAKIAASTRPTMPTGRCEST